jgi:hypothetical protein
MKKTISFLSLLIISGLLFFTQSGCKSDSVTNPLNTDAGVTLTMSQQVSQQGNVEFLAKSNVNIKIDSVVSKLASQNFSHTTMNQDPSVIFNADELFIVDEFSGVQTGQVWAFSFYGKRADNNTRYTVTSNYTIP